MVLNQMKIRIHSRVMVLGTVVLALTTWRKAYRCEFRSLRAHSRAHYWPQERRP